MRHSVSPISLDLTIRMLIFSKLGRKRIDRHRERKLNAGTELFVYLKAISARENGLSDRENVALHQMLRLECWYQ
ncbi:hypothetical protein, partial [Acinetobacter baumannii]|uniref:hypothetical protein n=1 Tax=Acinetobacter baumannii TaxID=470 RepID=UPI0028990D4A